MKIKPIKDLRNTNEISLECHKDDQPIFISKNGYNDLVIMSDDCYNNLKGTNKTVKFFDNTQVLRQDNELGFVKIALANINTKISDVNHNVNEIKRLIDKAFEKGVKVITFSELTISGYTCRDLFFNESLINSCFNGIKEIRKYSTNKDILITIGAPIKIENKLFNCLVSILNGEILAIIPKKHLNEVDERAFNEYDDKTKEIIFDDSNVIFGKNILFVASNFTGLKIAFEIGDDILNIDSSFNSLAANNMTLLINPCASIQINENIIPRRNILKSHSLIGKCAIASISAFKGESTTDYVLSGDNLIYENGETLFESNDLGEDELIITDIDINYLNSFKTSKAKNNINKIGFILNTSIKSMDRQYNAYPFLYEGKDAHAKYLEIIKTQAKGLIKRLEASYSKTLVIALSGGLDSTLALLVAKEAFEMSSRNTKDILAITMPCFGTSKRTHDNALALAEILGVTFKEINIKESVLKHFQDIDHDVNILNATYENSQARERTQIAMDIANDNNGMMLGTGDLSELCLGWATYNGDHMAMYGVNASIPKTLVRALTETYAREHKETKEVLEDIIGTPISPELLPLKDGQIEQKTEDKIGPYELVDFFIYHFLVNKFSLRKIMILTKQAFKEKYDDETIKKWLTSFIKRFYSSQFKRSCLPDGPKVTVASVSPRNGLYMPSDASVDTLLEDLESKITL